MTLRRKFTILFVLLAAALLSCAFRPEYLTEESMLQDLRGTWKGSFKVVTGKNRYVTDKAVMNITENGGDYTLYLTVDSCDAAYVTLGGWNVDGRTLTYNWNTAPWAASVSLEFDGENKLTGTYAQYGAKHEVSFIKTSPTPVDMSASPQFAIEGATGEEWFERLSEYPDFDEAETGRTIPFTYEMNSRLGLTQFIKVNKLDALVAAKKTDADKMLVLMDAVCANFKHDGASGMPERQDAAAVMAYVRENGGIECRGLSIILAELCRAYGIPAKPIKCTPSTDEIEFCHVVVHAYSKELKQWIMLDPTYHLALKNTSGRYVSLPMLREALISGQKLTPNANAGRNGRLFYMEYYRAYMTKNTFRFSSLLDVSSTNGGVSFETSVKKNGGKLYMLQPAGFPTENAKKRGEIPTADANAFWAAP